MDQTVVPELKTEFEIVERDGEFQLALHGPEGLRWVRKVPHKAFLDGLERYLEREKSKD